MKSFRDVSTTGKLSFRCDATGLVTSKSHPEHVALVTQEAVISSLELDLQIDAQIM